MLFGNLNNLAFIRPIVSFAWSRNLLAMHWILKFPDNLFISSPRSGPTPGCFQNGNNGGVSCPDPSLRRPWRDEMGISSDLSAARPATGIVVWVAFTEAHSVQSAAPGSMHLVSGFGNPGPEGSPAASCPDSGWVPCLGCLSDRPSADRWVDSNKPSLIGHVGTIKDVETPSSGSQTSMQAQAVG